MLEALRIRDFRLLWSARLVSALGTWLMVIAVPAYVLQLTGSLVATGLTLAAEYLPVLLLGPVAGVLSDRWDRRRLLIATDVFRAGAIALLLVVRTPDLVWVVYLALAAEGTGSVLFRPAAQAHTPAVVGTGTALSGANSLNALTEGTVRLIGAPLGAAFMVWVGFDALVLVDMVSYLASAVMILLTSPRLSGRGSATTTVGQIAADLAAGWRLLQRQSVARVLLPITIVFLTANASLSALLVPFGVTRLGGKEQAGLVVSALGVGFLIGAPLIRVLVDRVQPKHLLAAALAATAIGFYLLFMSSALVMASVAAVVIGVFGSMVLVTPQTTLQRVLPNEVLGRVSAVFFTGEALATLVGSVAGPALASRGGISLSMYIACAATLLAALASFLALPRMAVLVPAAESSGATQRTTDAVSAGQADAGHER
jgi:MFS family permease